MITVIRVKIKNIFFILFMMVIFLYFSDLTLAGDCAINLSGQGIPSTTSNHNYPPGWFEMEQTLILPSSGQTIYTQFIPSGAYVKVQISGVIGFWRDLSYGSDAAYIYYVPPETRHYPVTTPIRSLNIYFNNRRFDPQPPQYNPNHEYDSQTIGNGQSMPIQVRDSHYDDNGGSFAVTVSW